MPGDIFNGLKQLKKSQFSNIYQSAREQLKEQGIDIDVQLWYSQPENFHGDAMSDELIKCWLGDKYNIENFNIVKKYNSILSSGTKIFNTIQEQLSFHEDTLKLLNDELQKLENQILDGSSNKKSVNIGKQKLDKIWNEQEKINKNIEELNELIWG